LEALGHRRNADRPKEAVHREDEERERKGRFEQRLAAIVSEEK
jgi:hypothetical protein